MMTNKFIANSVDHASFSLNGSLTRTVLLTLGPFIFDATITTTHYTITTLPLPYQANRSGPGHDDKQTNPHASSSRPLPMGLMTLQYYKTVLQQTNRLTSVTSPRE